MHLRQSDQTLTNNNEQFNAILTHVLYVRLQKAPESIHNIC